MSAKILLVDDVDEVRTNIARMLSRKYEVKTARDAEEAVRLFAEEGPFPVVVSDFAMPGMDGLELLREVHAHVPETVGVLLTGVKDIDVAMRVVHEEGVFRFLAKPAGLETLAAAIDDALAEHERICESHQDEDRLLFAKESLECLAESLEERMDSQRDALRALQAFARDLCAAHDLSDIVRVAAQGASTVLSGRGVHVQVWDEQVRGRPVEAGAGPEMSSFMHREPLETREGRIGEIVVDVGTGRTRALSTIETALLASICASTAVATRNEFRRRERDHAQHATIIALAALAEQRDDETGKHLERVAAYCRLVAEGLRQDGCHGEVISDQWIHDLERSSALHDIGKVGIPDSILLKPGKLSSEEWEIMKTHAELGEKTLERVMRHFETNGFLAMGRDIAGAHHEKWDGSGYPRGLAGTRIPLAARILALADVYDALTTERPYKQAWTHEAALAWITERGGTHFDPDVVQAFVRRGAQASAIRQRLRDVPAHEPPDVLTRPA